MMADVESAAMMRMCDTPISCVLGRTFGGSSTGGRSGRRAVREVSATTIQFPNRVVRLRGRNCRSRLQDRGRSEERRVGKGCDSKCRSRGSTCHYKKKKKKTVIRENKYYI